MGLALLYAEGKDVPQDYAEAAKWYRKAAEAGDAKAQLFLADMYRDGKGVPKDLRQAEKWYRQSAKQGQSEACMMLDLIRLKTGGTAEECEPGPKTLLQD